MNKYGKFVGLFREFYNEDNIKIDEKLSSYVNFKVGGPADILLIPESKEQIKKSICICKENNIPVYVIGNGSNILVRDGGFRGVVISLKGVHNVTVNDERIEAECGAMLKAVSDKAMENSLTGFEFACGIPGTIGGAIRMNAGAHGSEMKDIVKTVTYIDGNGEIHKINNEQAKFEYRNSLFTNNEYIIVETELELNKGNREEIQAKIQEYANFRKEKQPIEYPSAGSTFKRGTDFITAKLIDECGLKGYQIGGAQVSEKHAGFIINTGNATSKDVEELIKYIKQEVYEKFGKEIETEIEIIH